MGKKYDNTNSGVLFKNEDRKSEKHPHYTGQMDVDGVEYWLSAWINESKTGQKYMSLRFNKKEPRPVPTDFEGKPLTAKDDWDDDDIPF